MIKLLYKKNKKLALCSFIFLILFAFYNPALAKLIQYTLSLIEKGKDFNFANLVFINIAVFSILALINWLSMYFSIQFKSQSQETLNRVYFEKIASDEKQLNTAEVIQSFNVDIPLIISSYLSSVSSILYFAFSFTFGAVLIFSLNRVMLVYTILVAVISLLISKKMSNRIAYSQKEYNDSLGKNSEILIDIFEKSIIYRIFNLVGFLGNRFADSSHKSAQKLFVLKKQRTLVSFSNDSFKWVLELGMYLIGAFLIFRHQLNFATLIAITQAASTVTTPILWFSTVLADLASTRKIRENILSVLLKEEEQKEYLKGEIHCIEVKNLVFVFDEGKIIGPINFELLAHKKYLLIGKNGSGKSSLFSSLTLENRNYEGQILVNGKNLKEIARHSYYKNIAYVSQKSKLYAGTVSQNITGFSENVDVQKLEKLKSLFVNEKNNFFDRTVENLSGGQQQLITIARALYKGGDIVYLDEPFSSLDRGTIKKVMMELLSLDKTVLISLHQYDSEILAQFDEVINLG